MGLFALGVDTDTSLFQKACVFFAIIPNINKRFGAGNWSLAMMQLTKTPHVNVMMQCGVQAVNSLYIVVANNSIEGSVCGAGAKYFHDFLPRQLCPLDAKHSLGVEPIHVVDLAQGAPAMSLKENLLMAMSVIVYHRSVASNPKRFKRHPADLVGDDFGNLFDAAMRQFQNTYTNIHYNRVLRRNDYMDLMSTSLRRLCAGSLAPAS